MRDAYCLSKLIFSFLFFSRAYKPILNTIIRDCQILYTAILDEPLSQDISKDQVIEDLMSSSQSISVDKKDISSSSQTDLQKVEAEKESECVVS